MGCWLSRSRCCWVSVVVLRPGEMQGRSQSSYLMECCMLYHLLFIPVIKVACARVSGILGIKRIAHTS